MANKYLEKIFNVIAPALIEETRSSVTPETSAMIGSSMGGLATLYSAIRFKEKFHTALALSPHWPLGGEPLVDWIINKLPNQDHFRIWMSRGDKKLDSSYKPDQDYADLSMRDLGWGKAYKSTVYKGAGHNEGAWAKQLADGLNFWLSD